MSARVFNPLVMSEMRRMMGRSNSDVGGRPAAMARVRRDLFGPVNHEDAQAFVEKELAAIRQRDTDKWGFDFVRETPTENSRFRWERVNPGENIHQFYPLRRLPLLGQQTEAAGLRTRDVSITATSTSDVQEATTQRPKHDVRETTTQRPKHDVRETTTRRPKPSDKQSQITDFLKCRKRSLSAGDISARKVGSATQGEISSAKVGVTSDPSKRKRSKTRQ